MTTAHEKRVLFSGIEVEKGSGSMGKIRIVGVLRLRATSAESPDKWERRFAQEDDFVAVLTKNTQNKEKGARQPNIMR